MDQLCGYCARCRGRLKTAENTLAVMQNRCLRLVAGDYKAALRRSLEADTQILSIQLHLNQLQAKARCGLQSRGRASQMPKARKLQQSWNFKGASESTYYHTWDEETGMGRKTFPSRLRSSTNAAISPAHNQQLVLGGKGVKITKRQYKHASMTNGSRSRGKIWKATDATWA